MGRPATFVHYEEASWKLTCSVTTLQAIGQVMGKLGDGEHQVDQGEEILLSLSWGFLQIPGAEYQRCNFSSVQAFCRYSSRGGPQQLDLIARFIKNTPELLQAVRLADFSGFCQHYPPAKGLADQMKAAANLLCA